MKVWIVVAAVLAVGATRAAAVHSAARSDATPASPSATSSNAKPASPPATSSNATSAAPPAATMKLDVRDEVREFVRGYVKATNEADVGALADLYVRVPEVTSVSQGHISRGWASIRAATDSLFRSQGGLLVDVGWIDVIPLAPQHAMAIAPATITVNTPMGRLQLLGAVSMVVRKTPEGWKILHEHASVQTLVPGLGD